MGNLKSFHEFQEKTGELESTNNYSAINKYKFLGKYQMGWRALADAGYYKGDIHPDPKGLYNMWDGTWENDDGVHSVNDFLNNKKAQDKAFREYNKKLWVYLKSVGAMKYIGKEINGIKITPSGLLAGAYLVGHIEMGRYLKSNGKYIPSDGNGTPVESRLKELADYDTYEITKIPTWEQYKKDNNIQSPKYTPDNVIKHYNKQTPANVERERKYYSDKRKEYNDYVNDVINFGEEKAKKRQAERINKSASTSNINGLPTDYTAAGLNTKDKLANNNAPALHPIYSYINNPKKSSELINFDGISHDGIPFKNWSEKNQRAFLEGVFGESLEEVDKKAREKRNSNNKKGNWTNKFNIGNPDTDDGHWVTLNNGKHIFIKDS